MFSKGEAVVYPMHGAGVIEEFEEKTIDGIKKNYYVLFLPLGGLKVMLPSDCIQKSGLRPILHESEIEGVLKKMSDAPSPMRIDSWSERYKENVDKMKSGKLCQAASVYYELFHKEKLKGLSSAEKKVMTTAKKIVLSEIMLGFDVEKNAAEDVLNQYL